MGSNCHLQLVCFQTQEPQLWHTQRGHCGHLQQVSLYSGQAILILESGTPRVRIYGWFTDQFAWGIYGYVTRDQFTPGGSQSIVRNTFTRWRSSAFHYSFTLLSSLNPSNTLQIHTLFYKLQFNLQKIIPFKETLLHSFVHVCTYTCVCVYIRVCLYVCECVHMPWHMWESETNCFSFYCVGPRDHTRVIGLGGKCLWLAELSTKGNSLRWEMSIKLGLIFKPCKLQSESYDLQAAKSFI